MITRTSGRALSEMHLVTGGASLAFPPFFEETTVRLSVPLIPRWIFMRRVRGRMYGSEDSLSGGIGVS